MASIVQGYEYDIFISYRQKDNKYDGWVSEFVDNLKKELEATFKEEVSVYFDINPHDGLLETHIVNASLKEKLKCLVFIPIISQTYCDPKSFAWQNEFCAFNQQAKEDQSGRDIKLSNGNVASRILPVKIHDLDQADKTILENELASVLRSVDFIYKSSGVNRPLKPDDSRTENLNHTYYRDQINKVANAVKEIITALKYRDEEPKDFTGSQIRLNSTSGAKKFRMLNLKTVVWTLLVLILAISVYFLLPALSKTSLENIDKSIAVLPFGNMSNDPDQEYFSNGMMEEILNHLFKIGGLKIPSSTSSMRYKGSKLSVREIASELNVSYVLEGNVSRSGDNVRIIVRMVNGKDERLIWTEDYKRALTAINLLEIQSDVAQQVAENMKVLINPEVKNRIEAKPTINTEAYNLFLQAKDLPLEKEKPLLEKAIILDPGFAEAYSRLAYYWIDRGMYDGDLDREQVLKKAEPLIEKALQLDINSVFSHTITATLRLWYYWDFVTVEKEYRTFMLIAPSNIDLHTWFTDYLLASGRFGEALNITKLDFDQDKKNAYNWAYLALAYYFNENQKAAIETIRTARRLFPEDKFLVDNALRISVYTAQYKNAIEIFEESYPDSLVHNIFPTLLGFTGIAYFESGNVSMSTIFLNELLSMSRKSPIGSPSFFAAAMYAAMGDNNNAIQFLEKAFNDHEVEMYWLKVEPLFIPLHGDRRFENLLLKIGLK